MNIGQKKAVDIVIEGHNLLLLGSAGTGKSFVINEIAKSLKKIGKNVQITCSTGIACSVYKGVNACTIHQFTGISDGRYGPDCITDVIKNNPKHEHVLKNIYNVDTLIVDECSMISKQVFDSVNNVCKIKDPSRDFGGIQIIFCGDFLQLPPVASPSYGDEGKYCFESDNFKKTFPHRVILTDIVRQSEEQFITAINEVCNGVISLESENFISKLNRHLDVQEGSRTVKLFAKNDLADDYNRKCLLEFPGNVYEFKSTDQGLAKKDVYNFCSSCIMAESRLPSYFIEKFIRQTCQRSPGICKGYS
jgi:ATP-dependent DNA helicase PIF1